MKGLVIGIYVNLALYNMLENNIVLQIINKPFTNLVYSLLGFYTNFIRTNAEGIDKGDIPFSKDNYSYIKTKDSKHIGIANLEPKFQKVFQNKLEKIYDEDNINKNIKEEYKEKFVYEHDTVSDIFSEHNRDEIFMKVNFLNKLVF